MSYLDESVAMLTHFEGSIGWMYRDSRGYITVGVGDMLPNAASAQALGFVDATGANASADAILAEYQRVAALAPAMSANAYRTAEALLLPDSAISAVLLSKVQAFETSLRGQFPAYDSYPDPAKLGLIDMIYNLGAYKLFNGFPTFVGCVTRTDWSGAAGECQRVGPNAERNSWTAAQFRQAAVNQAAANQAVANQAAAPAAGATA